MRQEVTNLGVEFFDITGKKEIMCGLDRGAPDRDCAAALLRSNFSDAYSASFHDRMLRSEAIILTKKASFVEIATHDQRIVLIVSAVIVSIGLGLAPTAFAKTA